MDLYCTRCAEPWDNDEFHYVAEEQGSTYKEVAANFRAEGCKAVTGKLCERKATDMGLAAEAMYDLLGDDMDGAAAMLEDFEMGCY